MKTKYSELNGSMHSSKKPGIYFRILKTAQDSKIKVFHVVSIQPDTSSEFSIH